MILEALIEYLGNALGIGVYAESPDELTDYVLIEQTGSSRTNHIITTTFAVQSYGASLLEAMILNGRVEEAMRGFTDLERVAKVELETDYNFTNAATKQYRWQAVYQVTHYRR